MCGICEGGVQNWEPCWTCSKLYNSLTLHHKSLCCVHDAYVIIVLRCVSLQVHTVSQQLCCLLAQCIWHGWLPAHACHTQQNHVYYRGTCGTYVHKATLGTSHQEYTVDELQADTNYSFTVDQTGFSGTGVLSTGSVFAMTFTAGTINNRKILKTPTLTTITEFCLFVLHF